MLIVVADEASADELATGINADGHRTSRLWHVQRSGLRTAAPPTRQSSVSGSSTAAPAEHVRHAGDGDGQRPLDASEKHRVWQGSE